MIRYLITGGSAALDERAWLNHLAQWIERDVDFIQIRERDLSARKLAELTRSVLKLRCSHSTRVLVNDRADVAAVSGADGVHLRDGSVQPGRFAGRGWTISVSCHDLSRLVETVEAQFILLSPVFRPLSKTAPGLVLGTEAITRANNLTSTPILALGGVTRENEKECTNAGAAGIAGISYFGNPGAAHRY